MAVRLALNTWTSIEFFLNLTVFDFLDIAMEVEEVLEHGK
jgi:hypothetical protein